MPHVLVQFDDATLMAIDRIAPGGKRGVVKDAIFRHGTKRMREAYRLQPDSIEESGAWELPDCNQGSFGE